MFEISVIFGLPLITSDMPNVSTTAFQQISGVTFMGAVGKTTISFIFVVVLILICHENY